MPQDIGAYALEVPGYRDRPDGPLAFIDLVNQLNDLFQVRDALLDALQPPLLAAGDPLPTSPPFDGYTVDYTTTGGAVWRLRYDLIGGQWLFVGGNELVALLASEVHKSGGSSGYTDPDTGSGPSITVPFAGTYRFRVSGWIGGVGTADLCSMGVSVAGAAVDSDQSIMNNNARDAACAAGWFATDHLSAGDTLVCKYRMDTVSNTGDYKNRLLAVLPDVLDG